METNKKYIKNSYICLECCHIWEKYSIEKVLSCPKCDSTHIKQR
jgi:DNA-directed RNA polymerase subunit RPC12/RpoP